MPVAIRSQAPVAVIAGRTRQDNAEIMQRLEEVVYRLRDKVAELGRDWAGNEAV
ncbi:MAG: hypothetical protein P4L40_24320 [Terracidiphilus sp.]|nr:hypothetical protein [Terracidiphilus sp.]